MVSENTDQSVLIRTVFGTRPLPQIDFFLILVSIVSSYFLAVRGNEILLRFLPVYLIFLLITLGIKPAILNASGIYETWTSNNVKRELRDLFLALLVASVITSLLIIVVSSFQSFDGIPRSILIADFAISLILLSLPRFLPKYHLHATASTRGGGPLTKLQILLSVTTLIFVSLVMTWKALDYPLLTDDLYHIRSFSSSELQSAWTAHWLPEKPRGVIIDQPAYGPLRTLFSHLQNEYFGENYLQHRIFMVVLFAVFLVLLIWLACKFGTPWPYALLGSFFALFARYNQADIMWLGKAVYLVMGILVLGSLIQLIIFFDHRGYIHLLYSIGLLCAALLFREVAVVGIVMMIVLAIYYARITKKLDKDRWVILSYAFTIFIVLFVFFVLRQHFVPTALGPSLHILDIPSGFRYVIFSFTGITTFDFLSSTAVAIWTIFLSFLVLSLVYLFIRKKAWETAAIWLACAAIGAVIVSINMLRVDLFLLPISFFAMFIAEVLSKISSISTNWYIAAVLIFCVTFAGVGYMYGIGLEAYHPSSSNIIDGNSQRIFGPLSNFISIPNERERIVRRYLVRFGIDSTDDVAPDTGLSLNQRTDRVALMMKEALADNRRRPDSSGNLFVPYLGFLQP